MRPCQKYVLPHRGVRDIAIRCSRDGEVSDDEDVKMSTSSISSDCADSADSVTRVDGAGGVAGKSFEARAESLDGFSDDELISVDQMITRQLEDTGSQAHRNLLRWIWGS